MRDSYIAVRLAVRRIRVKLAVFLYNLILPKELGNAERDEIFLYRLQRDKSFKKLVPMATKPTNDLTIVTHPSPHRQIDSITIVSADRPE